ncbi:hypothetical protein ACHAWO_002157 [Cyclotella atomus]|uniref:UBX domain-containing protein n=1 Tax=Cyclotella atomus TaxID=382360 RepID=A0ABD3QMR2_9STRA
MKSTLLLILQIVAAAATSSHRPSQRLPSLLSSHALPSNKKHRRQHHHEYRNVMPLSLPRGGSTSDEDTDELDPEQYENGSSHRSKDNTNTLPKRSVRHSVSTFSTALLSKLVPYYQLIVIRMRRGLVAGWDAAWHDNDDDDSSIDESGEDTAAADSGSSSSRREVPKLHSFLGKTGHVFMEVYRGVVSDDDAAITTATRCIDLSLTADGVKKKKKRKRRRKNKRRRHHHDNNKVTTKPTAIANGGGIDPQEDTISSLAKQYNIEIHPKHHSSIMHSTTTSFNEALQKSNADARFLICYISSNSSSSKHDNTVIPTLLNPQFTKLLQRKPLGKKNIDDSTGSYYIWICNTKSDKEAISRRLKLKPSKSSNSLLCIVHPASTIDPSGKLRISPKLIVQHHCNPPPSSLESMSAWITSTRKRHLRDYAKLQHDRKERMLYKERSEGYKRSMVEDEERQMRQEEELAIRRKKEKEEQSRLQELEKRRVVLLQNLGEEPTGTNNNDLITIALRFQQSGISSKNTEASCTRRFSKEDTMNNVLNWVDAVHGLERERVCLSTMNGAKSFVYRDEEDGEEGGSMTLEEAGLGKMTALRVGEIVLEDVDGGGGGGSVETDDADSAEVDDNDE